MATSIIWALNVRRSSRSLMLLQNCNCSPQNKHRCIQIPECLISYMMVMNLPVWNNIRSSYNASDTKTFCKAPSFLNHHENLLNYQITFRKCQLILLSILVALNVSLSPWTLTVLYTLFLIPKQWEIRTFFINQLPLTSPSSIKPVPQLCQKLGKIQKGLSWYSFQLRIPKQKSLSR